MQTFNILMVEDSELMRELMCISLSRLVKVNITEADDGLVAIKKLSSNRYDLVMADINMPVMDGIKLVKYIRNDSDHKDVPVIIISTQSNPDDIQKIKQMGVQAYLTKPVSGSEIAQTVKELLNIK